jgi:hypothetical protein
MVNRNKHLSFFSKRLSNRIASGVGFSTKNVMRRDKIIATAVSKSRNKENIPLILKNNESTAVFMQMSLTTSVRQIIDSIKSNGGLTNETMTKQKVVFGTGILRYEGSEWYDGAIFIGETQTSGRFLIKIVGEIGLKVVENICKSQEMVTVFSSLTVTQCIYYCTTSVDPKYQTMDQWRTGAVQTLGNCLTAKTLVVLNRDSLQLGKKSLNRLITFTPLSVIGKEQRFSKLLIKVVLSGTSAQRFLVTLLRKRTEVTNVMAYMVYDSLLSLSQNDDLLESMRGALNKEYRLGSVVMEDVQKSKAKQYSKELRPVMSACSTIVNKLLMSTYTESVFMILQEKLVKVMVERKGEIANVDTHINNLLESLKPLSKKP